MDGGANNEAVRRSAQKLLPILFSPMELALYRVNRTSKVQRGPAAHLTELGIDHLPEIDQRRFLALGILLEKNYERFNFVTACSTKSFRDCLNRVMRSQLEVNKASISNAKAQLSAANSDWSTDRIIAEILSNSALNY